MTGKHTPGPWFAERNSSFWEFGDGQHQLGDTCASSCQGDMAVGEANAKFIVHAVNCYDEMLAALKRIQAHVAIPRDKRGDDWHREGARILTAADAAITKAEAL